MPKAELHVHVEGTLEPEMRLRLAERNGVELPYRTADELAASYEYRDLSSFLALYFSGMDVLRTEQDFFDLTLAYLQRVHAQNVVYTEMHFDPQAHTSRGIGFDTVITGIRRAQEAAQDDLGIRSQLILGILRDMSAESAMEALAESLPYKDWIVGVGLDSDEKGNPPVKFREVFERARAEGYRLTMHCDHLQENSVEHIPAVPRCDWGGQDRPWLPCAGRRRAHRRCEAATGVPDVLHHIEPEQSCAAKGC